MFPFVYWINIQRKIPIMLTSLYCHLQSHMIVIQLRFVHLNETRTQTRWIPLALSHRYYTYHKPIVNFSGKYGIPYKHMHRISAQKQHNRKNLSTAQHITQISNENVIRLRWILSAFSWCAFHVNSWESSVYCCQRRLGMKSFNTILPFHIIVNMVYINRVVH